MIGYGVILPVATYCKHLFSWYIRIYEIKKRGYPVVMFILMYSVNLQ